MNQIQDSTFVARRYFFDTSYSYNVFGADEHLNVRLWRENKDRSAAKCIDSWSFATGIFAWESAIATRRAERRILKLRAVYGAEPF